MLLSSALLLALAAEPSLPKLAVLELAPSGGVDLATAAAFSETLATEIAARGHFSVVSDRDIRTLLGVERQRQLLGCSDSSCFTELAGAVGSRYVMSGSLARLEDRYQLNLQVIDTQTATPLGRSTFLAPTLSELRALLPWAVAQATQTEPPKSPSKVLPIALLAVGGAALVGGGVLGGVSLSQEGALSAELGRTASEAQPLGAPLASYEARVAAIGTQKTVALASMISGAAVAVLGVLLFPRGPAPGVALVPSDRGVALVGVLP